MSNQKLATIGRRKSKEHIQKNRTSATKSIIFSSPPIEGLYDTAEEMQAVKELLLHNIYDATPDHSILKHGLAKSLSTFELAEAGPEQNHSYSQSKSANKRNVKKTQGTPRYVMKKRNITGKASLGQLDPHQSLPSLTSDLNVLTQNSRKLAHSSDFLLDPTATYSETSDTESQQDLGLDFTGFQKTRDF